LQPPHGRGRRNRRRSGRHRPGPDRHPGNGSRGDRGALLPGGGVLRPHRDGRDPRRWRVSFRNTVAAEFTKLASLPSVFVALGLVLLVTPGVAALNTSALRHALDTGNTGALVDLSTIDAGLDGIPVGAIGAIVLGVTVISSEYTATRRGAGGGRQITATLTGLPRRVPLLAAKALVLSTVTALATAVAIPVSVRSEERRVGKECRWRGWTADSKQKRRR